MQMLRWASINLRRSNYIVSLCSPETDLMHLDRDSHMVAEARRAVDLLPKCFSVHCEHRGKFSRCVQSLRLAHKQNTSSNVIIRCFWKQIRTWAWGIKAQYSRYRLSCICLSSLWSAFVWGLHGARSASREFLTPKLKSVWRAARTFFWKPSVGMLTTSAKLFSEINRWDVWGLSWQTRDIQIS